MLVRLSNVDIRYRSDLTADEEGVSREDGSVITVLQKPANAVLRMARCVKTGYRDVTDLELLVVLWGERHSLGLVSTPNRESGFSERLAL